MHDHLTPLPPDQCHLLAGALGDTPETVISVHLLRRGLAHAFVAGEIDAPLAAIVQAFDLLTEPVGFGEDAAALWNLLRQIDGWTCVNVSATCAPDLEALISNELRTGIRLYGDVYHALLQPANMFHHEAVRRLTVDDLTLVQTAPDDVHGGGYDSIATMLREAVTAGAIVAGNLVAIASTYAQTDRHADLGVATLEPWRGRGFATAAASLVAAEVQREGMIPVWSAGETNAASLRIAKKLGFTEVGRRTYVITGEHQS